MKKICFSAVFLVTIITFAQNPVKRTVRITIDEVPVAVKSSFEKDFGVIKEEGNWMVHFILEQIEARSVARPIWYSYSIKSNAEKGEARYSPDGKLIYVKGLNRISS